MKMGRAAQTVRPDQTENSGNRVILDRMDQMAHVQTTLTATLAVQAQMARLEEMAEMAATAVTDKTVAVSRLPLSKASRTP